MSKRKKIKIQEFSFQGETLIADSSIEFVYHYDEQDGLYIIDSKDKELDIMTACEKEKDIKRVIQEEVVMTYDMYVDYPKDKLTKDAQKLQDAYRQRFRKK